MGYELQHLIINFKEVPICFNPRMGCELQPYTTSTLCSGQVFQSPYGVRVATLSKDEYYTLSWFQSPYEVRVATYKTNYCSYCGAFQSPYEVRVATTSRKQKHRSISFNPRMGYELQRVENNKLEERIVSIPVWGASCNGSARINAYRIIGFNPRMGCELQPTGGRS